MVPFALSQVVYLLSYYGLMLPTGYALAFKFGYGVRGVWRLGARWLQGRDFQPHQL